MKFLWTVSNWKHTGPVEPSLDLARAVREAGHDVSVEVGRPPPRDDSEAGVLRAMRDLPAAGAGARLAKHAFVARDLPDVARLAAWIRRERPDALVATLANDHRLLLAASRRAGGPPVTRLWFSDGAAAVKKRETEALRATPRIFVFGEAPRERLLAMGVAPSAIRLLGAPLDVRRTRARATDPAAARRRLGAPPDRFLLGIVARLQTHRRYELLWEAAAALARGGAPLRVAVLGRGTKAEEVAYAPVRTLGLADTVVFGGYLKGEAYASTVASFDAQLLLVPGSDPTCRALREGMALGVASLATRRGLLPSIVDDGKTGLLVDEDATSLAAALGRWMADRDGCRAMGAAARRKADRVFDAPRVAEAFLAAIPG